MTSISVIFVELKCASVREKPYSAECSYVFFFQNLKSFKILTPQAIHCTLHSRLLWNLPLTARDVNKKAMWSGKWYGKRPWLPYHFQKWYHTYGRRRPCWTKFKFETVMTNTVAVTMILHVTEERQYKIIKLLSNSTGACFISSRKSCPWWHCFKLARPK